MSKPEYVARKLIDENHWEVRGAFPDEGILGAVAIFYGSKAEVRAREYAETRNEELRLERVSIDRRVTVNVLSSGVEVLVDGFTDTYFRATTADHLQDAEERAEVLRERLRKAQG